MTELTVEGLFVGLPANLGRHGRAEVWSGIGKAPVTTATVALHETNLDGDRQADLKVHGGPDKAVYVYPVEHYATWRHADFDLAGCRVGENVSTSGATEDEVRVGDVWRWGTATVQVSQPRYPCFKFGMHTGRKETISAMIDSGRSGWYLRVLEVGQVPASGRMTLVDRQEHNPTITELFHLLAGDDEDLVRRGIDTPELAEAWRAALRRRLGRAVRAT